MVSRVARPVTGVLPVVQAGEILECAVQNAGRRIRIEFGKDATDFAIDRRRVGGIDEVRYVVVVPTFHPVFFLLRSALVHFLCYPGRAWLSTSVPHPPQSRNCSATSRMARLSGLAA